MMRHRISIIGGGVIGCAIAYTLSGNPIFEISVIEKNFEIPGINQSSRNAGVIHAGIYYSKNEEPLKSKMCVEGNKLLYDFCQREHVPYKKTGKLIVATNANEKEYLDYFYNNAVSNGVPDITKISIDEIQKLEPNISAISAIYVPTSGIVDVDKLVIKLKTLSEKRGVQFITSTEVIGIRSNNQGFLLKMICNNATISSAADIVINSAGLYSDEIAKMINKDSRFEIVPTRGEFAEYTNLYPLKITRNIYQAPYGYYKSTGEKADVKLDEYLKLLDSGLLLRTVGVHITPTLEPTNLSIGRISIVGPLKTVKVAKTDYSQGLKSPKQYLEKINNFLLQINQKDLRLHYSGIMAVEKNNTDFIIDKDKNFSSFINLIGIDSPGMTACLAIANNVDQIVQKVI